MSLTIQLLIKNNEKTLEESILSILPLKSPINAIDLGSKDDSLKICRKYGIETTTIKEDDYSKIRNEMLGDDWNFYIQPWEVLISGHDAIVKVAAGPLSYYLDIYQGEIVTREIRLWRNLKFQYPIFETIIDKKAQKLAGTVIWSGNPPKRGDMLDRIEKWRSRSGSIEPYYYEAWAMLQDERYDSFIAIATHYLSLDSQSKSAVMLRYYLAQIQAHIQKDMGQATRSILPCIVAKPLMAEFWCFLGDIFYCRKKYKKAVEFYTNAIILGEKREGDDNWPVEIVKYKDYPEKMIASCNEITAGATLYGSQKA